MDHISWLVDDAKKYGTKWRFAFCRIREETIFCVSEFRWWEYNPTVLNFSAADARFEKFKKATKGLEADATDGWIIIANNRDTSLTNVYEHPNESFLRVPGALSSCVLTLFDDTPPGDVAGTLKTSTFESTLKLTLADTPHQAAPFIGTDSLGAGILLQFFPS